MPTPTIDPLSGTVAIIVIGCLFGLGLCILGAIVPKAFSLFKDDDDER